MTINCTECGAFSAEERVCFSCIKSGITLANGEMMQFADLSEERRLRRTLTKWFFITLVFNVFLSIERIENTFNSKINDSAMSEQVAETCGSKTFLSAPSSKAAFQIIGSFELFLPTSSPNSAYTKSNTALFIEALSPLKHLQKEAQLQTRLFPFDFSGLSPPLLA